MICYGLDLLWFFKAWISNDIQMRTFCVITHTCCDSNDGLYKLPLPLKHGRTNALDKNYFWNYSPYRNLNTMLVKIGVPFYWHILTLIPAWDEQVNTCPGKKVWDEITLTFPNFYDAAVEVWEWISYFTPHYMMDVIPYPCRDWT